MKSVGMYWGPGLQVFPLCSELGYSLGWCQPREKIDWQEQCKFDLHWCGRFLFFVAPRPSSLELIHQQHCIGWNDANPEIGKESKAAKCICFRNEEVVLRGPDSS